MVQILLTFSSSTPFPSLLYHFFTFSSWEQSWRQPQQTTGKDGVYPRQIASPSQSQKSDSDSLIDMYRPTCDIFIKCTGFLSLMSTKELATISLLRCYSSFQCTYMCHLCSGGSVSHILELVLQHSCLLPPWDVTGLWTLTHWVTGNT